MLKAQSANYVLYVIICLIGGTTWAAQKIGLVDSLPLWSASWRFLLAGAILLVILLVRRKLVLNRETFKMASVYGLFYFAIPFGIVYIASEFLPSGLISIFGALVPLLALFFNRVLKGTPAQRVQLFGCLIALLGIVVVFSNQVALSVDDAALISIFILLLAFVITALTMAALKKNIERIDRMSFNVFSLLIGGLALLLLSLLFESGERRFGGISLAALIYLAVFGSAIGISINTHLLHAWHVAKMSSSLYLSPIIALVIGFVFLDEKLTLLTYVGSTMVLIGVYLINRRQRSRTIKTNVDSGVG